MNNLMELTKKFETLHYMERLNNKKSQTFVEKGYIPVILSIPHKNSKLSVLSSIVQSITGCYVIHNLEMEKEQYHENLGVLAKEKEIAYIVDLHSYPWEETTMLTIGESKKFEGINKIFSMNRMNAAKEEIASPVTYYAKEVLQKEAIQLTLNDASLHPETDKLSFTKLIFSLIQTVQYLDEFTRMKKE